MTTKVARTIAKGTEQLERVAAIDGEIAKIEADREASMAVIHATADEEALPLLEERRQLVAVLEPWWQRFAAELTSGKRKSVELGGCMIGSKAGRAKLVFAKGDDGAGFEALMPLRWAKPLIRIKHELNRAAITAALATARGKDLQALGFEQVRGADSFFVERVAQGGVVTGT